MCRYYQDYEIDDQKGISNLTQIYIEVCAFPVKSLELLYMYYMRSSNIFVSEKEN
jgi:hypothetical protein